jgi:hypothetical protein
MPRSGITPAKPGSAQASLARRARNVKDFHRLITHNLVKNSAVSYFSVEKQISPTILSPIFQKHRL